MAQLIPVDYDPFAKQSPQGLRLEPVDYDPFANQPQGPSVGVGADMAKGAGVGLAKGVMNIAASPVDAPNAAEFGVSYGLAKLAEKMGWLPNGRTAEELIKDAQSTFGEKKPLGSAMQKAVEGVTGDFYKPQTTAGKFAETAGEFIPGAMALPANGVGSMASNAVKYGVVPGLASEAAGQALKDTKYEWAGRLAGALGGAFLPGAAKAATSRVISPLPMDPARASMVATLEREGVPLTAGQITGSKPLQWAESTLGDLPLAGGKAADLQRAQQQAFTDAALKRAGGSGMATPENMASIKDSLRQRFGDLASRNTAQIDAQAAKQIGDSVADYVKLVPPANRAPGVGGTVDDILQLARSNGGAIPGDMYQAMRSRFGNISNSNRMNDPQLADVYRGFRDSLDGAMNRSISPADAAAWQEVRKQYGNMKSLEKAAGGAGAATAEGNISPAQLRTAVASGNNRGAYARGQGDLAELTRAGIGVMSPLPNSGTAPRQWMQNAAATLPAIVGGASGGGVGALAGLLAAPMAGRALMSSPIQAYLGNQAASKIGLLAQDPATLRALGLANAGYSGLLAR